MYSSDHLPTHTHPSPSAQHAPRAAARDGRAGSLDARAGGQLEWGARTHLVPRWIFDEGRAGATASRAARHAPHAHTHLRDHTPPRKGEPRPNAAVRLMALRRHPESFHRSKAPKNKEKDTVDILITGWRPSKRWKKTKNKQMDASELKGGIRLPRPAQTDTRRRRLSSIGASPPADG